MNTILGPPAKTPRKSNPWLEIVQQMVALMVNPVRGGLFIARRPSTSASFCFSAPKAFGAEKQKERRWWDSGFYKQATPNGVSVARLRGWCRSDDRVRLKGENPSIGIILRKEKNRTIVEYALRDTRKPIGVATYHTVKRLPKELKGQLPSPQQIVELLEAGS